MEFPDSKDGTDSIKQKEENLPIKFYANERLSNSLSLRKRKINDKISKHRGLEQFKKEGNKGYDIYKENLNIEQEIKNKIYDDVEIFLKEMKKYIKHENIEYNKYALYCLRIQITNNNNFNNKLYLASEYQKKDFLSDIIILFQKYFDDKQIIFEGLWIIINALYFLKDVTDLSLFLTNKNCINLYLKILDKKDDILRFHIYWLISNLLCNDKINVTNQVLFHLYMSPFFRLYIFKNLEEKISMTENEVIIIFNILSQLSNFINDTFICLSTNNIQHFIDYNSGVDYNSIQENNNFLFHHSIKHFTLNIENPKLRFYCMYGLSKLSNFFQDQKAYDEFFKSGVVRKLVKEQIKCEEDYIEYAVQIIGNYLSVTKDELIDLIFLEETLLFYIKLIQNYPERQMLKRDIYWSLSNITSGNEIFCEKFAQSGLLELSLQAICSDSDIVINEALYTLLGFFDSQNIELIVKYHHLDYIKCLTLCLKNLKERIKPGENKCNTDLVERVITCIGFLFENGEVLKGNLRNKFVNDFEKNGGFELIENMLSENIFNNTVQDLGEKLLQFRNN